MNNISKLAKKLKPIARENPIINDSYTIPHIRHWAMTDSGLKMCFTLKRLPGEEPFWHLSISKDNGMITQKEIDQCVQSFFDTDRRVDVQRGVINKNLIHLFQEENPA